MSDRMPFLIVSDSPGLSTGLGRIARELAERLHAAEEQLGIKVAQLGMYHDVDQQWPWPVWRVHDEKEYGAEDLARVWWRFAGERPGVIFTIWDPARALGIMQASKKLPVRLWGYFPIDGVNLRGSFGGPAAETVKGYERVLGYGHWGAQVLKRVTEKEVAFLPHGLDMRVWQPRGEQILQQGELSEGGNTPTVTIPLHKEYIGSVMANQPRKDFGTLFQAWALLKERLPGLKFWLHTDLQVKHWSVPQLAEDFGFNDPESLVVTEGLNDGQLAEWYSACWLTMLPSLGEGLGYPIVESMACGVPCLAYGEAGGRELTPRRWRVGAVAHKLESCYNIVRPVFSAQSWALAALQTLEWVKREPEVNKSFCTGAVAHLDWDHLFPRWAAWVNQGIKEIRG
jgi:glycosyltransferase involved in cell wall biosynthesis